MQVSRDIRNPEHSAVYGEKACAELQTLARLSARLGNDPLLVQASSGNTSVKIDGTLWIKASGKWLARAAQDAMFVPVDLADAEASLRRDIPICCCGGQRDGLRASIETAMHAALPHRVVIHVHSVKTLAWAVRADGPQRLAERLAGLQWRWVPYVASGLPLAHAIQDAMASAPRANVFVLANHGLVVCGETCESAEALLNTVESRVAVKPRETRGHDPALNDEIARLPEWRLPLSERIHALSTDEASLAILKAGVLYPCQAMFLGTSVPLLPASTTFEDAVQQFSRSYLTMPPFWIVEGRGLVIGNWMTTTQMAVLDGLAEVVQRIDASAPVRYINDGELTELLNEDAHCYRQSAESNAHV
jgi:rhamnose utilization protein RhaD (predicted bifunctional aldolase and dehydrogenase)